MCPSPFLSIAGRHSRTARKCASTLTANVLHRRHEQHARQEMES